jgi:hypothetical protein
VTKSIKSTEPKLQKSVMDVNIIRFVDSDKQVRVKLSVTISTKQLQTIPMSSDKFVQVIRIAVTKIKILKDPVVEGEFELD